MDETAVDDLGSQRLPLAAAVGDGVAARSPLQTALGGLWASLLGSAEVDADANFFMLGGDSLRGMLLLEHVRTVFGVTIPVEALFDTAGTVATMAQLIERLRARPSPGAGGTTIPRRPRGTAVPLSHPQARAWFLQRLDPGSVAYYEARLWRIDGALDIAALRAALGAVTARQPMLRTRFVVTDGEPRQVIDANAQVALEVVALAASADDEERGLREAVRAHAARPFDLSGATPCRWTLFQLAEGRHALLRVWHHILGDALSSRVVQKDVSDAYGLARTGRDPALPALPVDYADWTLWQAGQLSGAKLARLLAFWKAQLADLPMLALPADFKRPAVQGFAGGVVLSRLSREAVAAFASIGRAAGATPFVTFLAAFYALLARLSGDEDIVLGTPVAGRPMATMAEVIGFFANTVAVRVDLSGGPTTKELLRRTREQVLDVLEHQQLPFEQLVEVLGAPRDASRNPVFQVAFAMRDRDAVDLHLAGTAVRRMETGIERAKFDLTVTLLGGPDGIDARWEYCADLFERATIERMARQYATLVAGMAGAPDAPVGTLALMDTATRERILTAASATARACPAGVTIHQRFADQVHARPGAMAIESLAYEALEAAANRLAHELRAQGAGVGSFVAVARQKGADTAIAWLAVLKAGAAYLPLDPELPAERLAFMLSDARVAHAIADEALAGRLVRHGVRVIVPELDAARIVVRPSVAPPATLWRDLRPVLPEYMLPTSIVWLPSLPLNASGKVDRRALPAPSDAKAPRPGVRVPPRDMFEQVLVRIWEQLLGVAEVGVFDHFFEIGGHSLLAARLVDAIERETGLAAPLTALFIDDTIAGLVRVLREGAPDLLAPIVAVNDGGTLPPFVFLHGDFTGGGFYSRALAHGLGPDQPVLIVHPHGLVDAAIPESIEAMAADRIRALRAIRPHGPYVVGGHCNGAFVAFEMARQLLREGERVPAVVMIEAARTHRKRRRRGLDARRDVRDVRSRGSYPRAQPAGSPVRRAVALFAGNGSLPGWPVRSARRDPAFTQARRRAPRSGLVALRNECGGPRAARRPRDVDHPSRRRADEGRAHRDRPRIRARAPVIAPCRLRQ